jgi:hypothetical protein
MAFGPLGVKALMSKNFLFITFLPLDIFWEQLSQRFLPCMPIRIYKLTPKCLRGVEQNLDVL